MAIKVQRQLRHRFAPLDDTSNGSDTNGSLMQLQGIVFDMDGTLCEPQNYMFGEMRSSVGIPKGEDILDYVHSLPEAEQREAFDKIEAIEQKAMSSQVAQPGMVKLMEFLDRQGVRKAICTRNFETPVKHFVENHIPSHVRPFSPIIDREFRPPKPSPAGILHIAKGWGIKGAEQNLDTETDKHSLPLIMVGDSIDDMSAGRQAGALTVLLRSPGKEELETDESTDVVIDRLDELIDLLTKGMGGD